MNKYWQQYRELELISDCSTPIKFPAQQPSTPRPSTLWPSTPWLTRFWRAIDAALLRDLEPRVWQTTNLETGQTCWHFYDPDTGEIREINSEAELRQWLQWLFEQS